MRKTYLTTHEAAQVLRCNSPDAIRLLTTARVPSKRAGAAYLWDCPAVENLASLLDALNGCRGESMEARQV